MASKLYAMARAFNIGAVVKVTAEKLLQLDLPLTGCLYRFEIPVRVLSEAWYDPGETPHDRYTVPTAIIETQRYR